MMQIERHGLPSLVCSFCGWTVHKPDPASQGPPPLVRTGPGGDFTRDHHGQPPAADPVECNPDLARWWDESDSKFDGSDPRYMLTGERCREVFAYELAALSPSVALFVIRSFAAIAPEWFWHVPPSMSGRYHPREFRRPGGLVAHVKRTYWWAERLLDTLPPEQAAGIRDALLAAVLLHDLHKFSPPEILDDLGYDIDADNATRHHGDWTAACLVHLWDHSDRKLPGQMSEMDYLLIVEGVRCHMGRWGSPELPGEDTSDSHRRVVDLVHLADYIAAQRVPAEAGGVS
jgi:hypothetical protein